MGGRGGAADAGADAGGGDGDSGDGGEQDWIGLGWVEALCGVVCNQGTDSRGYLLK